MKKIYRRGKIMTELGFKTGKHIIFYRFQDKTCIVVRILHEKMDFDNNL